MPDCVVPVRSQVLPFLDDNLKLIFIQDFTGTA